MAKSRDKRIDDLERSTTSPPGLLSDGELAQKLMADFDDLPCASVDAFGVDDEWRRSMAILGSLILRGEL